jgi:excisionase family DNA binding protein
MSADRLLTAQEVAEILSVTLSWVREATRDGRLPHVALGRYRRYRRTEILGFIDDQRRGPGVGYGRH